MNLNKRPLKLILINTPMGTLGSGRGGGVETTLLSLLQGLTNRGNDITLITGCGSILPLNCDMDKFDLVEIEGEDQPSWQKLSYNNPVIIPDKGILPKMLIAALERGETADAVLNFGYDWLPLWITPWVNVRFFHLISMGNVANVMKDMIESLARFDQSCLAFHTQRQSSDFRLPSEARVVGNGFDLDEYTFRLETNGPLGWAGRISPEKGLEDAAAAAAALGEKLLVWGIQSDLDYVNYVEATVPEGTIEWRGFLPTAELQREMGECKALINTPKWNEAYGNVVVEALACGVPVVAYDRGGPGEIIQSGETGWLVPPDDVPALTKALTRCKEIDRQACRSWVEANATVEIFSKKVEDWLREVLNKEACFTAGS